MELLPQIPPKPSTLLSLPQLCTPRPSSHLLSHTEPEPRPEGIPQPCWEATVCTQRAHRPPPPPNRPHLLISQPPFQQLGPKSRILLFSSCISFLEGDPILPHIWGLQVLLRMGLVCTLTSPGEAGTPTPQAGAMTYIPLLGEERLGPWESKPPGARLARSWGGWPFINIIHKTDCVLYSWSP